MSVLAHLCFVLIESLVAWSSASKTSLWSHLWTKECLCALREDVACCLFVNKTRKAILLSMHDITERYIVVINMELYIKGRNALRAVELIGALVSGIRDVALLCVRERVIVRDYLDICDRRKRESRTEITDSGVQTQCRLLKYDVTIVSNGVSRFASIALNVNSEFAVRTGNAFGEDPPRPSLTGGSKE